MRLTHRLVYFILFLIACFSILSGLYLQYFQGLEPCLLCMLQRVFIIALLVIFLLAAIFIRGRKTQWLFNIVALLMTALGGLAAGRQIWLQHQSASAIQGLTCLPPVNFLLTNYPLEKVLHLMLKGSENCAQVHWFFMGLSLAEWSGVFFLISLLGILFQFRSIKKAR